MPSTSVRKAPKYCLHRATGCARVRIGKRTIWLGRYNSPESLQRYAQLIASLSAGNDPAVGTVPNDLTIVELVDRFWTWAGQHYRHSDGTPTSEIHNYKSALAPLLALYAETAVREFGPKCLKLVRDEMVRRGWCRRSVNQNMHRVRAVFRWGVEEELVPAPVHQALVAVRGLGKGRTDAPDRPPVRPVPQEHIDAIKDHVSKQVWALIRLQLLCGARPGELLPIRRQDIDTSGKVWTYTPMHHKNEHRGQERVIWFGPEAQKVLTPYLLRPEGAYLFSPRDAERERHAASPGGVHRRPDQLPNEKKTDRVVGKFYNIASYRRAIHRACQKAGVPSWSPHRLRHNAATSLRRDHGIETAQIVLGHRSPLVTEIYAEADTARAREAMLKFG